MMKFNPTSLNFYYSGVELPSKTTRCTLNISDVLDRPKYTIRIQYNQSQVDWLKVIGISNEDITDVPQEGYPLNINIKHNNSIIIPDGNYSAYVSVEFEGKSTGLNNEQASPYYDFASFQVFLTVSAGISGFSVNTDLAFLHLAKNSSSNPTQNLIFTSPNDFTISGSDKILANGFEMPYKVSANGSVILSTNNNARTLPNGMYEYLLQFKNGSYNYGSLPTKLMVTSSNDLEVFPIEFSLYGIKGITEPNWQNIYVYDPRNNVEVTSPDFIKIDLISTDHGFKTFTIKPVDSNILSPTTYNGQIVFTSNNSTIRASVKYELQGLYNESYKRPYHFTQDSEILELVKAVTQETTFLRLKLDLKFYSFDGKETKIDNRELDYFFYESKVEFDPGELIHEMFKHYDDSPNERFSELNKSSGIFPQYQFASIYFEVSEIDFSTLEVKNSYVIPTQYYIKGRRPVFLTENILLTHREGQVTRITKNSLISFNFIKYDNGNLILKLNDKIIDLPNTTKEGEIPQSPDVRIFGGIIKASDIENLKEYDLLEISFNNQRLYYQVEEEGINSVNIFYVNQWNLLDSFEFTGEFTIDTDYDRVTTNSFSKWVEITKTLHTSKSQKFKISSGYISLESVKILDEIMMSKKVFLVINNFTYEARPISSKLNNQTSKNNLIDRQLEFELKNKTNDSFYLF